MLIFFFIILSIMPITMIIFGQAFKKTSPKSINMGYGYRTTMSMKNQETWRFAHNYIGKLWFSIGFIEIIPTLIPLVIFINATKDTIGHVVYIIIIIQLLLLCFPIILTEIALKKQFDSNGNRK